MGEEFKIIDLEDFSKGWSDWFTSDKYGVSVIKTDALKRYLQSQSAAGEVLIDIANKLHNIAIEIESIGNEELAGKIGALAGRLFVHEITK